jgi:hypothetical protein
LQIRQGKKFNFVSKKPTIITKIISNYYFKLLVERIFTLDKKQIVPHYIMKLRIKKLPSMSMKSLEHAMKTPGLDFIDFRFFEGVKAKIIAPIFSLFVMLGAVIYGGPNSENPGGLIGDFANSIKDVITSGSGSTTEPKNFMGNSGGTKAPGLKGDSPDMNKMMSQLSGNQTTPNPKGIKNNSVSTKGIKSRDTMKEQERMKYLRNQSQNQSPQNHPANQRMPGQA